MGLSSLDLALKYLFFEKNKIGFVKHIVFSVIYVLIAILSICLPLTPELVAIICSAYLLTISANRICSNIELRKQRKVFRKIFNLLIAFIALGLGLLVMFTMDEATYISSLMMVFVIIIIVSLINILVFAFSSIQMGTLIKIMRKTYVFEVLYGLIVLIVSFSFVFNMFEDGIGSYWDALWYSFAIVTTIGFGDFTAVGGLSRVLSVILGMYGIIVVALITSVVVNFYNEVKTKNDDSTKDSEDKKEE